MPERKYLLRLPRNFIVFSLPLSLSLSLSLLYNFSLISISSFRRLKEIAGFAQALLFFVIIILFNFVVWATNSLYKIEYFEILRCLPPPCFTIVYLNQNE